MSPPQLAEARRPAASPVLSPPQGTAWGRCGQGSLMCSMDVFLLSSVLAGPSRRITSVGRRPCVSQVPTAGVALVSRVTS